MGFVQRRVDKVGQEEKNTFSDIGEPVKCDPIKITLREDAVPYSISVPRRIPIPLQPQVVKELQRMLDMKVIERVTEPTDWCSPIVPAIKPSGNVRICVDIKQLNESVFFFFFGDRQPCRSDLQSG